MPWKDASVVNQRKEFVLACLRGDQSITALCDAYGISRKTGYKWIARFHDGGIPALADLSRAPHSSPHRISEEVEEAIIDLRTRRATWGPKKLRAFLEQQNPTVHWPSTSSISALLKRRGLVMERKARRRTPLATHPLAAAKEPNIVWCTDFKGKFRVGREYCNPLTITDACSRYIFACRALEGERFEPTREVFERVFEEHGLPLRIRSDNGTPFASTAIGGLSQLSVWWIRLGILPERIEPGHPEQNGRHERMHRTLKLETASPPMNKMEAQQQAFESFRQDFNHVRPHEALGQRTPASLHTQSPRPYVNALGDPEYPATIDVRRVHGTGGIKVKGTRVHLGKVLADQLVGLELIDDGNWQLWFGPIYLGLLQEKAVGQSRLVRNKPTVSSDR